MIEMGFVRKHREFEKGRIVRVINVTSVEFTKGKKPQAYVSYEYDATSYDLESGDNVLVYTHIKKAIEHASWFFRGEDLRKVETIMEARDSMDIEQIMESITTNTWEQLYSKHKASAKGKKYGL